MIHDELMNHGPCVPLHSVCLGMQYWYALVGLKIQGRRQPSVCTKLVSLFFGVALVTCSQRYLWFCAIFELRSRRHSPLFETAWERHPSSSLPILRPTRGQMVLRGTRSPRSPRNKMSSTRIRRVLAEADESASHGLFFEVEEGTCPNADWTITVVSAARPRTRKVFLHSKRSDLRRNAG